MFLLWNICNRYKKGQLPTFEIIALFSLQNTWSSQLNTLEEDNLTAYYGHVNVSFLFFKLIYQAENIF